MPYNVFFPLCFHFLKQCSEQAKLPYEDILECYSGELGTRLQLDAEAKTKQLASPREMLSFVPTIIYDHVSKLSKSSRRSGVLMIFFFQFQQYDNEKQERSLFEFSNVLCREIKSISDQIPSICAHLNL